MDVSYLAMPLQCLHSVIIIRHREHGMVSKAFSPVFIPITRYPYMQEQKSSFSETAGLLKFLSFTPGVGQTRAFTCFAYFQEFYRSSFCCSSSFNCIFLPMPSDQLQTVNQTSTRALIKCVSTRCDLTFNKQSVSRHYYVFSVIDFLLSVHILPLAK